MKAGLWKDKILFEKGWKEMLSKRQTVLFVWPMKPVAEVNSEHSRKN